MTGQSLLADRGSRNSSYVVNPSDQAHGKAESRKSCKAWPIVLEAESVTARKARLLVTPVKAITRIASERSRLSTSNGSRSTHRVRAETETDRALRPVEHGLLQFLVQYRQALWSLAVTSMPRPFARTMSGWGTLVLPKSNGRSDFARIAAISSSARNDRNSCSVRSLRKSLRLPSQRRGAFASTASSNSSSTSIQRPGTWSLEARNGASV